MFILACQIPQTVLNFNCYYIEFVDHLGETDILIILNIPTNKHEIYS